MGTLNTTNTNLTGNLFTPNRPMFNLATQAIQSPADTWTSDTILYNYDANVDTTSSWNKSTGKYVIPVAGHYFIWFDGTTNDSDSHFIEVWHSGFSTSARLYNTRALQYGDAFRSGSISFIVNSAVGDEVTWRRRGSAYDFYSVSIGLYLIG
tara:strand:+ start:80 stop:535 length:456 start_codon:yes stop_codon:yes gene_type:complete